MAGGINAWNGIVADGEYESEMAYFSGASGANELISLSWALEEGNRVFYERLSGEATDREAASIFRSLALAEERHTEALRELHARLSPGCGLPVPPEGMAAGSFLENGTPIGETLDRVRGKATRELLEISIAMEANALDRYIKMARAVADEESRTVFLSLSAEERSHLERMAELLDRVAP